LEKIVGGWHELCILAGELSPMTHDSKHQRSQQTGTSITKAGQQIGCGPMRQCVAQWLNQKTGTGCLS